MRNDDICIDILHLVEYTHCYFDGLGTLRFTQQKGGGKKRAIWYEWRDSIVSDNLAAAEISMFL
jgi:hypothetical protein